MADVNTLVPARDNGKNIFQSKTMWSNLAMAVLPLIPGANIWISANPQAYSLIVGALNVGLRCLSEKKISWSWSF